MHLRFASEPLSPDRFIRLRCMVLRPAASGLWGAPCEGCRITPSDTNWLLALASVIRSMAPGHKFSSFAVLQNVSSRLHRDQHNLQGSSNLVFPLTYFEGGELWVQREGGESSMAGRRGQVLPLLQDGVPTPQTFDPRALHSTLPWSGDRVVVAAYSIHHP